MFAIDSIDMTDPQAMTSMITLNGDVVETTLEVPMQ